MYELIHTSIQKVITSINDQLDALESFIDNFVKENCLCKKLLTIPYIGPINAYALAYVMEDPKYYKNGREFAARAGTTPSFTGTGGEIKILGVGHKGCSVLKRTIYQPALTMYRRNKTDCENDLEQKKNRTTNSPWISQLSERKPLKKVVCAICNKMARIAWAIAADENCKGYEESKTSLIYKIRTGAIEQIDHSDNELLN